MTLRRVLVEISVVEQRYQAVPEVRAGATVTDVAERFGVCRQTLHEWLARYRDEGSGRARPAPTVNAPS